MDHHIFLLFPLSFLEQLILFYLLFQWEDRDGYFDLWVQIKVINDFVNFLYWFAFFVLFLPIVTCIKNS